MQGTWTIGTKLTLAFVCVATITLFVGIAGFYGAERGRGTIEEIARIRLPSVDSLLTMAERTEAIRGNLRTLIIPGLPAAQRQRQYEGMQASKAAYENALAIFESLPRTEEAGRAWAPFAAAFQSLSQENARILDLLQEQEAHTRAYDQSPMARTLPYPSALRKAQLLVLQAGIRFKTQVQEWKNILLRGVSPKDFGRYFRQFEAEEKAVQALLTEATDLMNALGMDTRAIRQLLADHQELGGRYRKSLQRHDFQADPGAGQRIDRELRGVDRAASEGMEALMADISARAAAMEKLSLDLQHQALSVAATHQRKAIALLGEVVRINKEMAAAESHAAQRQAAFIKALVLGFSIAGVLLALGLGLLITRGVNSSLSRIIAGLFEGADQVASASGQVSSASVSLAEGASEQAASIEETSSSLEEMSAMIRQNADNAGEANALMGQTRQVVDTANRSMQELTVSMDAISRASQETSKIIKTIDGIAFQTNLLALNAAVEAARAGEAGAGFAVVADEVRNLAMRAAEAARNTAALIEGTVRKVEEGSGLVTRTHQAFGEVAVQNTQVGQLVAEIAAAAKEQSQGIDQINKATSEMDRVTQQNAANAEESASASEEMNAQAEQMKAMVQELVAMVGGAASRKASLAAQKGAGEFRHLEPPRTGKTIPAHGGASGHGKGLQRPATKAGGREIHPRQVIPMEDEDCTGF